MIPYQTLWGQWIVLAIMGGMGLVAAFYLVYLAGERPRRKPAEKSGTWMETFQAFPTILILTYIGTFTFTVTYTIWIALTGEPM